MSTTDIARHFDQVCGNRPDADAAAGPDLARYRPYVSHLDLPEAQEAAMMLAVWRIMQNAVDRAFGHDPVQQCRQVSIEDKTSAVDEVITQPVIDLPNTPLHDDNQMTDAASRHHIIEGTTEEEKR